MHGECTRDTPVTLSGAWPLHPILLKIGSQQPTFMVSVQTKGGWASLAPSTFMGEGVGGEGR